jgi:threonine/homoserine/homoserine lactone efflux protein
MRLRRRRTLSPSSSTAWLDRGMGALLVATALALVDLP